MTHGELGSLIDILILLHGDWIQHGGPQGIFNAFCAVTLLHYKIIQMK